MKYCLDGLGDNNGLTDFDLTGLSLGFFWIGQVWMDLEKVINRIQIVNVPPGFIVLHFLDSLEVISLIFVVSFNCLNGLDRLDSQQQRDVLMMGLSSRWSGWSGWSRWSRWSEGDEDVVDKCNTTANGVLPPSLYIYCIYCNQLSLIYTVLYIL